MQYIREELIESYLECRPRARCANPSKWEERILNAVSAQGARVVGSLKHRDTSSALGRAFRYIDEGWPGGKQFLRGTLCRVAEKTDVDRVHA
jgi:hypothetical protein